MNENLVRNKSTNWTARILLWIFWPIVWLIVVTVAQKILDGVRGDMVEAARLSGSIGGTVQSYGAINGIVMTALMIALPIGFILIARITRR